MSPSEEKSEQVLPNVTVQSSRVSGSVRGSRDSGNLCTTIAEGNGTVFPNKEVVSSPEKEIALGDQEKAMQKEADKMRKATNV